MSSRSRCQWPPTGKVYLSPINDCFDGLVINWSVGTHPDAELVNAAKLGCVVGELDKPGDRTKAALLGSLSGFAKVLEEFGGKWDEADRVYFFANWPMLEAALQHVSEERGKSRLL